MTEKLQKPGTIMISWTYTSSSDNSSCLPHNTLVTFSADLVRSDLHNNKAQERSPRFGVIVVKFQTILFFFPAKPSSSARAVSSIPRCFGTGRPEQAGSFFRKKKAAL